MYNSLGRHGAGKNIELLSRSYSVERSGHRHVRSRGISASVRRERIHRRDEDDDDDDDAEEGD